MTKLSDYESMMINLLGIDKDAYERSKRIHESFPSIVYDRRKNFSWDEPGKKARHPKIINVSK